MESEAKSAGINYGNWKTTRLLAYLMLLLPVILIGIALLIQRSVSSEDLAYLYPYTGTFLVVTIVNLTAARWLLEKSAKDTIGGFIAPNHVIIFFAIGETAFILGFVDFYLFGLWEFAAPFFAIGAAYWLYNYSKLDDWEREYKEKTRTRLP